MVDYELNYPESSQVFFRSATREKALLLSVERRVRVAKHEQYFKQESLTRLA
jgi:hypothetical protein